MTYCIKLFLFLKSCYLFMKHLTRVEITQLPWTRNLTYDFTKMDCWFTSLCTLIRNHKSGFCGSVQVYLKPCVSLKWCFMAIRRSLISRNGWVSHDDLAIVFHFWFRMVWDQMEPLASIHLCTPLYSCIEPAPTFSITTMFNIITITRDCSKQLKLLVIKSYSPK